MWRKLLATTFTTRTAKYAGVVSAAVTCTVACAAPLSVSAQPAASSPSSATRSIVTYSKPAEDDNRPTNYPVNIELGQLIADRPPNLQLRGLVFVTRHGSRTPISYLPNQTKEEFQQLWGNCPLGDHSRIPCQRGLLTHFGELQLSSVGWHMRHRYIHADGFFPAEFDPAFFKLRSTDLPRTKLSLLRMVQGLYPGVHMDTIAPLVEAREQKDETLYPNHYHCPRLKELYVEACHATRQAEPEKFPAAARYKAIADSPDAVQLREKFARIFNTPASKLGTWVVIGDELKCRQSVDFPQVQGVTQAMADRANELAEQTFWHIMRAGEDPAHCSQVPSCKNSSDLLFSDKSPVESEVTRLGMGRLIKEIFDGFDQLKQSSNTSTTAASTPRAVFLSGHDTTIAPLLASLHSTHALMRPNYPEPGWPTLGSNLVLELLEKRDEERHENLSAIKKEEAAERRSLEQSLAPLPPTTVDDDEHHLPEQHRKKKQQQSSAASTTKPAEKDAAFNPHGAPALPKAIQEKSDAQLTPIVTRKPLVASPQTRWFVRLLVDHKEISILPYDDYQHIRKQYEVQNWVEECKQTSTDALPPHSW